jgi:hypothetical protein
MPRVVPSQVVAYLDAAFPGIAGGHAGDLVINQTHTAVVSPVVSLVDAIPEEIIDTLPVAQGALLLAATEILRACVVRWGQPVTAGYPPHQQGTTPVLNNRHPLEVVRTILSGCPDQGPAAHIPDLAFLGQADLATVLRQDMTTADSALANGEFKAAAVMAGSVVESFLLWAVQRQGWGAPQWQAAHAAWMLRRQAEGKPLRGFNADVLRWDLEDLIGIARELPAIAGDVAAAAYVAKDYRNLIHPGRAQRTQQTPTRGTAMSAVGAMHLVGEDLAQRVQAGTL